MKVLYIGHYKENGGWSQAATDQILALDSVGVDVACRNVTLTQDKENVHPKILELEQKDSYGCDVCIQHVLPHHLIGTDKFKKNISFLELESTSIKNLAWFNHLQQMSEIWVPNQDLLDSLQEDEIGVPIKLVHHTFDMNKYTQKYPSLNVPEALGKFKFYYMGDLNDRKNIESIITCFHSEFDKSENATLVVKVKKFAKNPEENKSIIDNILGNIKNSFRMYPKLEDYNQDITITVEASEENVYSIHQYCDCFLCPSHGEAWSIPSFEAMVFGNTPICSNFGGPKEFITDDENTGKLIEGVYSVCKCSDAAFPDIFTGRELWFQPCEKQIKNQMRKYYESYKEDPIKHKREAKIAGLESAKRFSYENIGNKMKELLSE